MRKQELFLFKELFEVKIHLMSKNNNLTFFHKPALLLLLMYLVGIVFFLFIIFDENSSVQIDYFTIVIGTITSFVYYYYSQRIFDGKLFLHFSVLNLILLVIILIKEFLFGFSFFALYYAITPILYLLYFMLLIHLFFKDNSTENDISIVYSSKYGIKYSGQELGYQPTKAEKLFSNLLFIGLHAILICPILIATILKHYKIGFN